MAKLFYTLDEVCDKLGKSEDEVREMVSSGQIQEFRDRDKLMFKVDQIDLLAGDDDEDVDDLQLSLEETSGGSGLELSGSGIPLADTGESTGVSVFDTETPDEPAKPTEGDTGDDAGGTGGDAGGDSGGSAAPLSDTAGESFGDELNLEAVGSGSGLLDLTRESDDTSFGAELLEEVYSGDENIEIPANASGLFDATESAPEEVAAVSDMSSSASMPMVVEAYDGSGSGLGVGLLIGATGALVALAMIVIVTMLGATSQLALQMADNIWMWVGILAGGTILLGVIGMFIGKASE